MKDPDTKAAWLRALGWSVIVASGFTVSMLVALHWLRPDLEPQSHAMSEYVNGPYGALMTATLFAQSLGSLAVAFAIMSLGLNQRRARTGILLFVVAAMGGAVAGIFPADPESATLTSAGKIHAAAGILRFLSISFAVVLLSTALATDPRWQTVGRALKLLAILFVIVFVGSIFVLANLGLFGLGQRLFIGILLIWMFLTAYPMTRIGRSPGL